MNKKMIALLLLFPLIASCSGGGAGKEDVHKAIDSFDASGAAALAKYDTATRNQSDVEFKYLDSDSAVKLDDVYRKLGYPEGETSSETTVAHNQLAFAAIMVTDPLVQPSVSYIEEKGEEFNVEPTYEVGDEYRVYISFSEVIKDFTVDNAKFDLGKATYLEVRFNKVGLVTFLDETYAYAKQTENEKSPTIKFAYRHQVSYTWKALA